MNDQEFKCENCVSTENPFKVTVLSPCREHLHIEIYYNKHIVNIFREFPEYIDTIENI